MRFRRACRTNGSAAAITALPSTTAEASIQRYLGFWDCNPTTLIPLSPRDSAPLYVEMMGGAREDHGPGPATA